MFREGLIKGNKLDFPISIKQVQKDKLVKVTYKDQDELCNALLNYLEVNEKYGKVADLIKEFGLHDTVNLFDIRTLDLLNKYRYYSSPATPAAPFDSEIWFYTVNTLSRALEVRLF